jgi:isopentenyl-diphosphate delta-isomerase
MKDQKEKVVLVDEKDKEIGIEEKIKAHREGKLHRAFSIFIFNSKGELLLQKRAKSKYHSGGLWSNTCCSHPRPKETMDEAVKRRLKEEMGIECEFKFFDKIIYKAKVGDLIENEIDYIFVGNFDGNPRPSKDEVEDWKWIKIDDLKDDIKKNPEKYTPWLKIILSKVKL